MADQNPLGQSSGPNIGQTSNQTPDLKSPPVNLPTKPVGGLGSIPVAPPVPPAPPKPSFTPPPAPAANIPPKPMVPPPSPPASGSIPPPPPLTSPGLKSSIRTMEEDLAALKKGQAPTPFNVQKPPGPPLPTTPKPPVFGSMPPPPPAPTTSPVTPPIFKPTPPRPQFTPQTFPSPEKAVGVPPKDKFPMPPRPGAGIELGVPPPSRNSFSLTTIIVIVVVLAIVGFSVWFFFYHQPQAVLTQRPTPSGTIVSSTTPLPSIEEVFQVVAVTTNVNQDIFPRLKETVKTQIPVTGEPALFRLFKPQSLTGEAYTLSAFSSSSYTQTPPAVLSSVIDGNFYVTLVKESNGNIGYGFMVKAGNIVNLKAALTSWEGSLKSNFSTLFAFNPAKVASSVFLDNTYQNTHIRFINFPDPTITIDYAIVAAPNGENYLVFTNSRAHVYSIIDKILLIPASSQ